MGTLWDAEHAVRNARTLASAQARHDAAAPPEGPDDDLPTPESEARDRLNTTPSSILAWLSDECGFEDESIVMTAIEDAHESGERKLIPAEALLLIFNGTPNQIVAAAHLLREAYRHATEPECNLLAIEISLKREREELAQIEAKLQERAEAVEDAREAA